MNLYDRWLLPPILDLIMRQKHPEIPAYLGRRSRACGSAGLELPATLIARAGVLIE